MNEGRDGAARDPGGSGSRPEPTRATPPRGDADDGRLVVRPVRAEDRAAVIELLTATFPSRVAAGGWSRLFAYPWLEAPPDYGHLAEENGRVIGFLGAIYADREIRGERIRVCGITSWCVSRDQRSMRVGTRLTREFLDDKVRRGIPIVVLTAGPHIRRYLKRLGCTPFRTFQRVRYALPGPGALGWGGPVAVPPSSLTEAEIGAEAARVVRYHDGGVFRVRAFRSDGRACVVVTRRRTCRVDRPGLLARMAPERRGGGGGVFGWVDRLRDIVAGTVVATELVYVSDHAFLERHRRTLFFRMAMEDRTVAVTGDPVLLGLPPATLPETDDDYLYVNVPDSLGPSDFDALYSEMVLLEFG